MKNNITTNKKNLSSFGFKNYYLTESGKLYKTAPTEQEIKSDSNNRFILIDTTGRRKRISLKKLYKIVFNKEFSIDTIENLSGEEWQPIANTNGKYYVSNCGRIKSYCGYNAILLKPYFNSKGYQQIKINYKNVMIHQIVAFTFCENRYKKGDVKIQIHHINKNRTDNRAENLKILSIEEHQKIHNRKETTNNE